MDADSLNQMLLAGSAIVLLAVLAVRGSVRVGLPSLLIYLGMGIILGEALLGIRFDDASTAQALGFAALVVILTEGGLTTRWSEVRPSLGVGLALATVGVGVSVCLVAVFAHFALDLSWQLSFLLGAITSPTDAAAVFTVLRRVPLKPSLLGALEAESGLNDAPTVLLVVLISTEHSVQGGALGFAALVVYELVGGAVLGAAVGWLGAMLLRRVALPASGLYPISVLAIAVLSYSGSAALHASGFAAVYVTALILGNSELPHRASTRSFAEGLAWLAQIGLFIMLGLLASPGTFTTGQVVGGVVLGAALTLVARPLSVIVSRCPFGLPWREQGFLAVAGLRGAVPDRAGDHPAGRTGRSLGRDLQRRVRAGRRPHVDHGPGAARSGAHLRRHRRTSARRRRRGGAARTDRRRPASGQDHGEVAVCTVSRSASSGCPKGTSVSLIVRGDSSFTPDLRTSLRRGDDILVVTRRKDREATERRLQAVSRGGRLAGWTSARRRTR